MAQTPTNMRLWNSIVIQAKAKFRVYPCPAAAHWVHKMYKDRGGQFKGKAEHPGKLEK